MKSIIEKINESLLIERYHGRSKFKLKDDFVIANIDEYEDAPEEFDEKVIEKCKKEKWVNDEGYYLPKGTGLEYDYDDNYGRSFFSIINGPAKGMSFGVFTEFTEDM